MIRHNPESGFLALRVTVEFEHTIALHYQPYDELRAEVSSHSHQQDLIAQTSVNSLEPKNVECHFYISQQNF
jgi:hypothetical protein